MVLFCGQWGAREMSVEWLRHAFEKAPVGEQRKECRGKAWAGIILGQFSALGWARE